MIINDIYIKSNIKLIFNNDTLPQKKQNRPQIIKYSSNLRLKNLTSHQLSIH